MSYQNTNTGGAYGGGSAIPGNNVAAWLTSPMMRGLWLSLIAQAMMSNPMFMQQQQTPAAVPGTPPLPAAGAGSGDPTAGVAGGTPGTVTPPPPGALQNAVAPSPPTNVSPPAPQVPKTPPFDPSDRER